MASADSSLTVEADERMDSPPLVGEFSATGGQLVKLEWNQSEITWKGLTSKDTGVRLAWCDVIAVHSEKLHKGTYAKSPATSSDDRLFTIHYIQHSGNLMRHKHVTLIGHSDKVKEWVDHINSHIPSDRPRRLLVIINPIGGKKKGVEIYMETVYPLFNLAGICADVKATERFRHAEEIGQNYDFSSIDGVVVSGGDGLLEEFLHTFIPRYQEGLDINAPGVELKHIPITVGTLPTGTGNMMSKTCVGCEDVETSALHIVTGRTRRLNIISVHEPGKLIGFSAVGVGYGFWSDLITQTEEKRWLKTLRVYVSLLQSMLSKRRQFSVVGEYLPADLDDRSGQATESGWSPFQGRYTGVNVLVPGFYRDEALGLLKNGQDGHGFNLLLEKATGKIKYMAWMAKLGKHDIDSLEADFLEHHYVKAYRVRVVHEEGAEALSRQEERYRELEHFLSVDGELRRTEKKELEVRLQHKLIEFYSSPYEKYQQ